MNIFITGGSGFVGSNLAKLLLRRGHQVTAIGRSEPQHRFDRENYRFVAADTTCKGPWQKELADADAIVNLTGATIFRRWTEKYKKQIYDSRILTTRNIVEALPSSTNLTLCSASGAGYYGSRGDNVLKEDESAGRDFLAGVSIDWEKGALLGVTGERQRGSGSRHAVRSYPREKRRCHVQTDTCI